MSRNHTYIRKTWLQVLTLFSLVFYTPIHLWWHSISILSCRRSVIKYTWMYVHMRPQIHRAINIIPVNQQNVINHLSILWSKSAQTKPSKSNVWEYKVYPEIDDLIWFLNFPSTLEFRLDGTKIIGGNKASYHGVHLIKYDTRVLSSTSSVILPPSLLV